MSFGNIDTTIRKFEEEMTTLEKKGEDLDWNEADPDIWRYKDNHRCGTIRRRHIRGNWREKNI